MSLDRGTDRIPTAADERDRPTPSNEYPPGLSTNRRFSMSTTLNDAAPQKQQIAWAPLIWIGALHVGALLAFNPAYFTWQALALCFFLHWVTGGLGITMTYHRLLTHRSFATRPKALNMS